jgi:hypothetical protein
MLRTAEATVIVRNVGGVKIVLDVNECIDSQKLAGISAKINATRSIAIIPK